MKIAIAQAGGGVGASTFGLALACQLVKDNDKLVHFVDSHEFLSCWDLPKKIETFRSLPEWRLRRQAGLVRHSDDWSEPDLIAIINGDSYDFNEFDKVVMVGTNSYYSLRSILNRKGVDLFVFVMHEDRVLTEHDVRGVCPPKSDLLVINWDKNIARMSDAGLLWRIAEKFPLVFDDPSNLLQDKDKIRHKIRSRCTSASMPNDTVWT